MAEGRVSLSELVKREQERMGQPPSEGFQSKPVPPEGMGFDPNSLSLDPNLKVNVVGGPAKTQPFVPPPVQQTTPQYSQQVSPELQKYINTTNARVEEYTVPSEIVPLPSEGKIYPKWHPFHCMDRVEIKAMTATEENILSSPGLLRQGKAIDVLIKTCLFVNLDPAELIDGDRNALMLAIRVSGYGDQYSPDITCPHCEQTNKPNPPFNLNKLPIKPLGAEPVRVGENLFKFLLPKSKREVFFKLLNGIENRRLEEDLEAINKSGSNTVPGLEPVVTLKLQYQIVSLGGVTDPGQISKLIAVMSPMDSRELRRYIEKISPKVDMLQKFVCPNSRCGRETEVDIPLTADFFW
jgi:hypothetical protein